MSAKKNSTPIENAASIIEKFGGIRPMASKINVAVTTVQGWKKRGAIPAGRLEKIESAAIEHNIDLSDVLSLSTPSENIAVEKTAAPQSEKTEALKKAAPKIKTPSKPIAEKILQKENVTDGEGDNSIPTDQETEVEKASIIISMIHDDIMQKITQTERRAVQKSTITTILLIALTVGAIAVLFWPKNNDAINEQQLAAERAKLEAVTQELNALKDDIGTIKDRQGFFGQVIPDDLNDRLGELKTQASEAKSSALTAIEEARTISSGLVTGSTEALDARIASLESQLGKLGNAPLMSSLVQRYDAFTATGGGQNLMEQSTGELGKIFSGLGNSDDAEVQAALETARDESPALSQSLEGVPPQDLKAAAMLMTMTQLRSSLNRDGVPFNEDLELLQSLIGEDNPALADSITRLSPHAQEGVLSAGGLSEELKSLTGEVVVASLKGEEIGIKDRAKARLNGLFQLEKDGELITGTETQATIAKAEHALEQDDLLSAITQMKSLDGDAAQVVAPWLDKAQASLLAKELKSTLSGALTSKSGGIGGYTASGGSGTSKLLYDPISGTAVLQRQKGAPGLNGTGAIPNFEQ